jgi:hypothetical protein
MRKITKKGDINLSFGMIFSIVLIAVFIFAAIYGINFFLRSAKGMQIGSFYQDLQREVNVAFSAQSVQNKKFSVNLPGNIDKICFANLSAQITNDEDYPYIDLYQFEDANLFLIPPENALGLAYKKINRINITRITGGENPYCVKNGDVLILSKRIYDRDVLIQKEVPL